MIAARVRRMGGGHWLVLYGFIIGAWGLLYAMALPTDLRAGAAIYGADFLQSLCIVTPDAAGFGGIVIMWALMSAAMMAPTALPAFATYEDLAHTGQTRFGVLVMVNLAIGLITPPVGINLYVAANITHLPLERIARAALPFLAISVIGLAIVAAVPALSLFLPEMLK